MSDLYLTPAEIERLTGRVYGAAQCKVLAERGWKFEPDANGAPVVLRAYHDMRMGMTPATKRRGPRLQGLAKA
jgi:hypothetical protein